MRKTLLWQPCRFENTLSDLRDCEEALGDTSDLSGSEARAAVRLIETCFSIARMFSSHPINVPTKEAIRDMLELETHDPTDNDD